MKIHSWGLSVVIELALIAAGHAQDQVVAPDLARIADGKSWKLAGADAQFVQEDGRQAVHLQTKAKASDNVDHAAAALVEGLVFRQGTIEVDLKGRDKRQGSFLGVTFHAVDDKTYEAVYFRPFNFRADPPFRTRAVQYVSWPEHTWQKLREKTPGVFENAVDPVPDPDGWFHARIEVTPKEVSVFVNQAQKPSLVVSRLTDRETGGVGLWAGVFDGVFANLRITPR